MHHRIVAIVAAAAAVVGLGVVAAPQARAMFTCSDATGYVRDRAGKPISDAQVTVEQREEYCYSPPAVTDGAGRYTVKVAGATRGQGRATATAAGYQPQSKTVSSTPLVPSGQPLVSGSNDFSLATTNAGV